MKNHRFLWLRNRTTNNRKCEKARNIKEKRTIEMFNTVSRKQEEQASSQRDRETYPNEEGVAGRSPARSTAKRGALRLRDLSRRGYSLQELKKTPVFMHWGFYFAKS